MDRHHVVALDICGRVVAHFCVCGRGKICEKNGGLEWQSNPVLQPWEQIDCNVHCYLLLYIFVRDTTCVGCL
jgi:hypothetical protein